MREINYQLVSIKRRAEDPALIRPYLFEDIFASSPWLICFLTVLLVGVISYYFKDAAESEFNYRALVYTVAGALILVSGMNMLIMKFLSNWKHRLSEHDIKASLSGGLLVTALLAFVASGVFLFPWDMPLSHKIFIILFFVLFCCSLELFIVHSALGYFPLLAGGYFVLLMILPGAGVVGRVIAGPLGYYLGLTLAQVIIFFIQWFLFSHQFGFSFALKKDLLAYARRDPASLLIGFLLAAGLFADKLVAWVLGVGNTSFPLFQATYNVNIAFSLAFFFVLPAFVYFILKSEKGCYRRYRDFFESIRLKQPLEEINTRQKELSNFILRSSSAVMKILLSLVFLFTYFATQVYTILGLDLEDIPLFRTSVWGNALYILFTCVCLLLYFTNWNRAVILLYALFAGLNVLFSALNILFIQVHPMYVFPAVCFISLLCALPLSVYYLKNFLPMHFRRLPLGYQFKKVSHDEYWVQLLKEGNDGE